MSKPNAFDSSIFEENTPSRSLPPVDFMKPMDQPLQPVAKQSPPPPTTAERAASEPRPAEAHELPPSPPVVRHAPRRKPQRKVALTPFDPGDAPRNYGFFMYPSRHEQLKEIAFMLNCKPWEVLETAMAEYIEKRYPGRK